jgi:translation initiation factor IF-3
LKVNREIRAPKVRLINQDGEQVGVVLVREAQAMAQAVNLDLVEVVPNAVPPVCKIIDYGKFRYDQTKREKESKRAQHAHRLKEVKFRPNIDTHDFDVKARRAREFLSKGHKVKVTCMFRGREQAHPEIGRQLLNKLIEELSDVAQVEMPFRRMGRFLTLVLAPVGKRN